MAVNDDKTGLRDAIAEQMGEALKAKEVERALLAQAERCAHCRGVIGMPPRCTRCGTYWPRGER